MPKYTVSLPVRIVEEGVSPDLKAGVHPDGDIYYFRVEWQVVAPDRAAAGQLVSKVLKSLSDWRTV